MCDFLLLGQIVVVLQFPGSGRDLQSWFALPVCQGKPAKRTGLPRPSLPHAGSVCRLALANRQGKPTLQVPAGTWTL